MYSLILSDDIVERIDIKARRMGLSRSGLINQILAESLSVVTPEQRMKNMYELMQKQMEALSDSFKVSIVPGENAFSAVSWLKYKYLPTIRYNVVLYRGKEHIGEIRAILRTQNAQLMAEFQSFVKLWHGIETAVCGKNISCELKGGIYRRLIDLPQGELTPQEASQKITDYINLFNRCVNRFISRDCGIEEVCKEITDAYVLAHKDGKTSI